MKWRLGIIIFFLFIASLASAEQVATLTFSPDGGEYTGTIFVKVFCATPLAKIFYTTDGSEPTESSWRDWGSITVQTSCTLKAKAFAVGMSPSETKSAEFTIITPTPTISPNGGLYAEPQRVRLYSESISIPIYYTLDGQDPTIASLSIANGKRVLIDHTCTLKAAALRQGCELSNVASADFVFRTPVIMHVRGDGDNANDGLVWASAKKTVQNALFGLIPGDEVWVAAGRYLSVVNLPIGAKLFGGFAGNETECVQRNPRANRTILDGSGRYSIITCGPSEGSATVIDGLVLQNGTPNAVYCDRSFVTIRNCIMAGNEGTACIELSPCTRPCVIENNLMVGNQADGIVTRYPSGGEVSRTISNNTLVFNSGMAVNLGCGSGTIRNNLVAFNGGGVYSGGCSSSGPATMSRNCVFGNGQDYAYPFPSPHPTDINVDPLFQDMANGDYRLRWDSPCIDAGTNEGAPTTDLEGSIRPMDGNRDGIAITDIGAYESPMPVQIDILHDAIHLQPNKLVHVAILSDPVFNALNVDPATVFFGLGNAQEIHGKGHPQDINSDGLTDLLFHFSCAESGIVPGYQTVTLSGKLMSGEDFIGWDRLTGISK